MLRITALMLALTALPASAEPRVSAEPRARLVEAADPAIAGMNAAALRRVDSLIQAAIAAKVTPGAALAIGRNGHLVRLRGYGHTDYGPRAQRVTERTIYDLASLTKPVATTTATMLLVQDGLLDLDAPLAVYLPEWRGLDDRARMTARHLLNHTSGLPAGGVLSGVGRDRSRLVAHLATVPLRAPPGVRSEYSDYGMILLCALVERLAGEGMDRMLERRVFEPLGLEDTGFNPLRWNATSPFHLAGTNAGPLLPRVAPTERTAQRGLIHGVVHDPLAHRLDGVAGHAGLFGSAHDMALYADMLLAGGRFDDVEILSPELVLGFTSRPAPASRFALGWELASDKNSSGGAFRPAAFGHTGFTGTSIWVDPDRSLYVVLLTNRLNPNSREQRHLKLRRDVHAALATAFSD